MEDLQSGSEEHNPMSIEVRFITKTFGDFVALNNISVLIPTGELVALLGPSGSGKTTLLRIIAGLDAPDSGVVMFHGEDATQRSVKDRQAGFVFQHYALFRHMSVFDNVAFGLKVLPRHIRPSRKDIGDKVMELLRLVQIECLADRYPSQISGGQRQRVALARALAVEPKVLLLDEPFGALDAKVRKELRRWLRRLHDEIHLTSVLVTHDQEEALEVADRVVVMRQGMIEQVGKPEEVYDQPATPFVYRFLGDVNLFHGRMHEGTVHIGEMEFYMPGHDDAEGIPAVAYVRPHDIEICRSRNGEPAFAATVTRIVRKGPAMQLELQDQLTGENINAVLGRERFAELSLLEGETVYAFFRNPKIFANIGSGVNRDEAEYG
ncbi:MAG TPA: sulfate ABC transporter ATP-binding protein, partial [Dissulfurispiraceae bacterium]|nr:sulfate ABC transporter ATP-binding protein [Dissulfurispiraceae bacterium]